MFGTLQALQICKSIKTKVTGLVICNFIFDIMCFTQVFTLMKRDSYTRFIKSEFYQSYLVREFENDKSKDKV